MPYRFKEVRLQSGKSVAEVAAELGVAETSVRKEQRLQKAFARPARPSGRPVWRDHRLPSWASCSFHVTQTGICTGFSGCAANASRVPCVGCALRLGPGQQHGTTDPFSRRQDASIRRCDRRIHFGAGIYNRISADMSAAQSGGSQSI